MRNLCAGRYALRVRGAIACNLAFIMNENISQMWPADIFTVEQFRSRYEERSQKLKRKQTWNLSQTFFQVISVLFADLCISWSKNNLKWVFLKSSPKSFDDTKSVLHCVKKIYFNVFCYFGQSKWQISKWIKKVIIIVTKKTKLFYIDHTLIRFQEELQL